MVGIRKKSLIFLIFLIGSWVVLPLAQAQVFKWTDQKGIINFTDDLSKIPPEYRGKIEKEYQFKETREEPKKEELTKEEKKEEKLERKPN